MLSRELGILRSDFLVHWTGKDIHTDYKTLSKAHREAYKNRLRDTLIGEPNGLWMTRNEEEITVPGQYRISYSDTPMTCFTEIKLSVIHRHTELYGCLGSGFSREFVLQNCGAPVQYVAATQDDAISRNLHILLSIIEELQGCDQTNYTRLHEAIKPIILYLKPMSDCRHPHDFRFLDESEWRVLYYSNDGQPNVTPLGKDNTPPAKITFEQEDLKVLIFPDSETRELALRDDDIFGWFGRDFPIMVTIEECLSF